MGVIRKLSPSVVNQIAAGEVVERPASVVKELMENAIDAKARRVEVSVERGGKDLIRIADDGEGMAPDDLLLAFQPHATSKLAEAEDLHRIRTLGFRGEALAAIAEISKVRCQTRRADAEEGSEIQIEGGIAGPIKSCGGPPGTVMEVRNLFFNTPVRRTFLKSDGTEAGHVAETFSRIALAHPEVHLTFRSGGKIVHDLPAVTGIRDRIATFFGRELAESLLWIEGRLENIGLWGYVGHPSQSRSSTKNQYLFLGGRYVRDRSLSHAAQRGVSRLADGRPQPDRLPEPGDPPRGGRRQRPPDQDRGPIPRSPADLQPPALDPPADVPGQRPAQPVTARPGRQARRPRGPAPGAPASTRPAGSRRPGVVRPRRRADRPPGGGVLVRADHPSACRRAAEDPRPHRPGSTPRVVAVAPRPIRVRLGPDLRRIRRSETVRSGEGSDRPRRRTTPSPSTASGAPVGEIGSGFKETGGRRSRSTTVT